MSENPAAVAVLVHHSRAHLNRLIATAAAMIGSDDKRGFITVLRKRLSSFPQTADEIVDVVRGGQVVIIAACVSPFVGLTEADEHEAGLFSFEIIGGCVKEERIIGQILPQRRRVTNQLGDILRSRNLKSLEIGFPSGPDRQVAPLDVEDVGKDVPRAKDGNTIVHTGAAI